MSVDPAICHSVIRRACCLALASAAEAPDSGFGSASDVVIEERALDLMATVVERYVTDTIGASASALATASNRHEIGVMDIIAVSNFSRCNTGEMSGAISRRQKRKCQIQLINPAATSPNNKRPGRGKGLLECPQLTGDEITRSLLSSPGGLIPQGLPHPAMPTLKPEDTFQSPLGKASDKQEDGAEHPMVPAHFPAWLNREIVNGYNELQKNVAAGKLQPEKKAVDENEKLSEAKAFTAAVRGTTADKGNNDANNGGGEEGKQESVKGEAAGQTKRTGGVGRIRIAR
ncbi:hypothetical protein FOL46_003229 [Perkinsus olseni]|nr:hypothetical protein FOL46_003229 [Perkinsus olseni]